MTTEPTLHVAPSAEQLLESLTEWLQSAAAEAVRERGTAHWALSGGSTPRPLYEKLAHTRTIPWSALRLFLVDERDVNRRDPLSNFRMIRESLLDRLNPPPLAVFPWLTKVDPRESLSRYRQALALLPRHEGFPSLDVALQGMGGDGHTASVFPHSPQQHSEDWVAFGPGPESFRFTLTLPLLARARRIAFLVTGRGKAERVRECIRGNVDLPAAWLSRHGSDVHWFLDADSASEL